MSLDADLLNQIVPLRIKAAQLIDALPAGVHASRRSGQSLDLSDLRVYQSGDEIRHIDWRASGKRDRLFVRQYTGERQMKVGLLVDLSPSMRYRHRVGWDKRRVAIHLAAVLIQLLHSQGDAVGLGLYAPDRFEVERPFQSPDHQHRLYDRLESALNEEGSTTHPTGRPSLPSILRQAEERVGSVDSWILFSDFLDEDPQSDALVRELQMTRSRQRGITFFQILEQRTELEFQFGEEEILFEDLETGETVNVGQEEWMEESSREATHRQRMWRSAMTAAGVEWIEVDTESPVFDPVYRWIERRNARSRQ